MTEQYFQETKILTPFTYIFTEMQRFLHINELEFDQWNTYTRNIKYIQDPERPHQYTFDIDVIKSKKEEIKNFISSLSNYLKKKFSKFKLISHQYDSDIDDNINSKLNSTITQLIKPGPFKNDTDDTNLKNCILIYYFCRSIFITITEKMDLSYAKHFFILVFEYNRKKNTNTDKYMSEYKYEDNSPDKILSYIKNEKNNIGGKRSRRNRKSKKTRKSRKNRRKSNRRSRQNRSIQRSDK
jgi:hypothetical protein